MENMIEFPVITIMLVYMQRGGIMKMSDIVVTALLILGFLSWGLIGFFNFNLIAAIFGEASVASRVL
jgi:hypothetical protein